MIENEHPRNGATTRQGFGEVYRTQDGGKTWAKMSGDFNVSPKGPYYFSQIFVDPKNDKRIYVTQDTFFKTFVQSARIANRIGWSLNGPTPRAIRP